MIVTGKSLEEYREDFLHTFPRVRRTDLPKYAFKEFEKVYPAGLEVNKACRWIVENIALKKTGKGTRYKYKSLYRRFFMWICEKEKVEYLDVDEAVHIIHYSLDEGVLYEEKRQ